MIIDNFTYQFDRQNALIAGFIAESCNLLENHFSKIVSNQVSNILEHEHYSEGTAQLLRNFESARVESIVFCENYRLTDKYKFSIGFEIGGQSLTLGMTPHQDAELSSDSFEERISIPTVSNCNKQLFNAIILDLEEHFDRYGPKPVLAKEVLNPLLIDINPLIAVAKGIVNYDLNILAELLLDSKSESNRFIAACNKLDSELLNSPQLISAVSQVLVSTFANDFGFIYQNKSLDYAHSIAVSVFNDVSTIEKDFAVAFLDGIQGMGGIREQRFFEEVENGNVTKTFYWPHISHAQLCELDCIDLRIKEQMISYKLSEILVNTLEHAIFENPKLSEPNKPQTYELSTLSL